MDPIEGNMPRFQPTITSPKVFCVPIRPLLIFLAAFGIARCAIQFWTSDDIGNHIYFFFTLLLNVLLFFGALKNNTYALSISMYVSMFSIGFATLRFLIYPIFVSNFIASGLAQHNETSPIPPSIGNHTIEEQRFFIGMVSGYMIEAISGLLIGVECFKYFLIKKMFHHAKELEYPTFGAR